MSGIKRSIVALLACKLMTGLGRPKVKGDDLKRADFRISTQRLGLRFNETIRDMFRLRWVRRARP